MAVRQLVPGSSVAGPDGPLRVRLDAPPGVRLEFRDAVTNAPVEPAHRASATEAILMPMGRSLLVGGVPTLAGQPFQPGTLVGITVMPAAGDGDHLVRPRADVGGRTFAGLIRVNPGSPVTLEDALEARVVDDLKPFVARSWHRTGNYGYHAHHDATAGERGPWAFVVDGSASMLLPSRRAALVGVMECLVGVAGTARGSAPVAAVVCSFPDPRAFTDALETDAVDWSAALGKQPSPWNRVTPGLDLALAGTRKEGLAVLLLAGPPVDLDDLCAWPGRAGHRLLVVVLGRSRNEYLPSRRPNHAWDDELGCLEVLSRVDGVTLVSVSDASAVPERAVEFADALFPAQARTPR